MKYHFLLLTFLALPGLLIAEDPPASVLTLAEVDARIAALEQDMQAAQADRYRQKHQIEYNDRSAMPLRVEAKQYEKEVLDLRKAYDMRLRVINKEVRDAEAKISRLQQEAIKASQEADAIQREILFARNHGDEASGDRLAGLENERALAATNATALSAEALALTQTLQQRKSDVAARDEQATALAAQLAEKENVYRQAFGALHQNLERAPEVLALDEARQKLAAELQAYRELRAQLLQSGP
jgi:uncharacterized small protein (DUF1192 family)